LDAEFARRIGGQRAMLDLGRQPGGGQHVEQENGGAWDRDDELAQHPVVLSPKFQ
jgi:hypothetical protein